MISNTLELEHFQRKLHADARVQVREFLQPGAADALATCLLQEVPWQLAERSTGASRTSGRGAYPDDAALQALLGIAYERASEQYQFAYDSYMLVRAAKEGWDPQLLVHHLLPFFNDSQFITFARCLSGDPGIERVSAQCTRYRSGHFLMPHEDLDEQEGRRYAYVLNLSRDWRADWGGQLQFLDDNDTVLDTFLPNWNSLSLFRVPQRHQVTLVSPWARQPRLAITGWWLGSAS